MDKSGKRNRFLDALAGRNVQEEPEKFPEIPLKDMVQTLEGVTEEAWGRYAFAREPLERKFTSQEKDAYTVKANACGREWAKRISEKYGTEDPKILAGKMGMKVKMPKVPTGGGVVLFAQYVQPDEITIFTDCVDKAAALENSAAARFLKRSACWKFCWHTNCFMQWRNNMQEKFLPEQRKLSCGENHSPTVL